MYKAPAVVSPRRAGDPAQLIASSEKAVKVLGWKPQYNDLNTIIASAWKWHWLTTQEELLKCIMDLTLAAAR